MPTKRMIDPAIWQSETIASFTHQQRLLFIGLFSNADDQGRLGGRPALIRSIIFPYDDISIEEIANDIKAIEASGSIEVYTHEGKTYIQVTGWWDYQSPQWAYPSKIPPPEGWQDRLRYRRGGKVFTENWQDDGGFNDDDNSGNDPPSNNTPPDGLGKALGNGLGKALPYTHSIVQDSLDKDNIITTTPANTLANHFTQKTGLLPKGIVEAQTWEDDCQEILDKAKGDMRHAEGVMDEAIVTLDGLGYNYTCPASLLNTIDKILTPKAKRSKNGRHSQVNQAGKARDRPSPRSSDREAIKAQIKRERAKRAPPG